MGSGPGFNVGVFLWVVAQVSLWGYSCGWWPRFQCGGIPVGRGPGFNVGVFLWVETQVSMWGYSCGWWPRFQCGCIPVGRDSGFNVGVFLWVEAQVSMWGYSKHLRASNTLNTLYTKGEETLGGLAL